MILTEDYVDLETPSGTMRTHRVRPAAAGIYPGVVLFSEIFQVTGPILRTARLLASQGYIVAIPEIFHEFEPAGEPFPIPRRGPTRAIAIRSKRTCRDTITMPAWCWTISWVCPNAAASWDV